jgi:hypothetical protein
MLTNEYDGSPSLLEYDSSASPSLLSISADTTANRNTMESEADANSNTKVSKADANSNTKESEADDSSVSSLSTSESIREKGYHFPEAGTIPSTVAIAKSAIKSNPVTWSSPRQRQAKGPTVDSPTSSVLSPIKKRHLHVEESSEIVIAETERKVWCPEDLTPCCKDPACVFGHTCKCNSHREMDAVLVGECFSVFNFKKSGYCTTSCLYKLALDRIKYHRKAEETKTNSFAFFEMRSVTFITSTSHSWNDDIPTPAQSLVFMFQVFFRHVLQILILRLL